MNTDSSNDPPDRLSLREFKDILETNPLSMNSYIIYV